MAGFSIETWIRGSQCGQGGLLQPDRYFELVNQVVEEWFAQGLALSFAELHFERRIGVPAGELSLRLHAPVVRGERIRLCLQVARLGNRTVELHISASCNAAPRFEANAVLAMADLSAPVLRSHPIPPPLRARMAAFDQVRGSHDPAVPRELER